MPKTLSQTSARRKSWRSGIFVTAVVMLVSSGAAVFLPGAQSPTRAAVAVQNSVDSVADKLRPSTWPTANAAAAKACTAKTGAQCKRATAKQCRVTKTKRAKAQGKAVRKQKIAKACASYAKRHCRSKAEVKKRADSRAKCARVTPSKPGTSKPGTTKPGTSAPPVTSKPRDYVVSTGKTPTASTTGVPTTNGLRVINGDQVIRVDGTVLDRVDIRGKVRIKANNVTIKNSVIRGVPMPNGTDYTLLANLEGNTGLVVKNTTIKGENINRGLAGFKGRNVVFDQVEIKDVVDNMQVIGGNVKVYNSWLHSNIHMPDPNRADGWTHDDNIQIEGGANTEVVNNVMANSHTASIMVTQNAGRTSNIYAAYNNFSNGACTINLAEKGKGPIENVRVEYNTFNQPQFKDCGIISPLTTKPQIKGNKWADGRAMVTIRRGA